jgi:hypothetical protein
METVKTENRCVVDDKGLPIYWYAVEIVEKIIEQPK